MALEYLEDSRDHNFPRRLFCCVKAISIGQKVGRNQTRNTGLRRKILNSVILELERIGYYHRVPSELGKGDVHKFSGLLGIK